MTTFTPEEIQNMYKPFPVDEHQIREGNRSSNGDRIQWFVYLDRPAIQKRLEDVFPFEWEFTHSDAVEHSDKSFSASGLITIRGLKRGYNGAQSEMHGEHTPKGAVTDAFRRAASMWGVGFYLYEIPTIWTASYAKGEWDKKAKLEQEAFSKFAQWHASKFKADNITPITKPAEPAEPETMTGLMATKVKYIQQGNNKLLVFNTQPQARMYNREALRKLGADWKTFADELAPGPDTQAAVDLPGPVVLSAERKTNQQTGEIYHVATTIEFPEGA